MTQFRWNEYNRAELVECGLDTPAIERGVRYFTAALNDLQFDKEKYGPDQVAEFVNEVFMTAQNRAVWEAAGAMSSGNIGEAMLLQDVVHVMAHLAKYTVAEIGWQQSHAAFEAAVEELIGA